MRKVIVTGGAGFIGSHLVDRLLENGDRVICIDNFDPYYNRSIKENNINSHRMNNKYRLVEEDIRNLDTFRDKITEDIDVIVHLAAKAGVRPSVKDPVGFQEVNVMGTQNILEFAKERDVKQFIFASSSSVYGTNENVPWSEDDHVLKPISPYASTKVNGELMGHVYSELYDMQFLALRFFTVYGPRQRPDLAIHKFLRLMSNGEQITLYGDGSSRRDYTYIDDIIDGVMAAIDYTDSMYEIINLGNNRTVQLLELVEAIEEASGIEADNKTHAPEVPGDVEQTWADVSKARELLGYNPNYNLYKGLKKFVQWYQNTSIN
ncbi:GDP-mannose 4,6-dehydratase [Aliifodinibius sp. S!AR15-10]|uniref:GDP-mannose 4,6-dehydratase n=1 Tax=Aliifodinibius sp. S!AR15-10 TaxID=2950437 RepID=UPI002866F179|nr:GDP-mannose 4,6-dehydratase [Aliifodinibius sp. S!AR15-10]MDR8393384.1 GDP-mannose 4,6-dehydratase [Aliifodinibius sp. S!AR15-10]